VNGESVDHRDELERRAADLERVVEERDARIARLERDVGLLEDRLARRAGQLRAIRATRRYRVAHAAWRVRRALWRAVPRGGPRG
jgi:predicted nuclease with TOPRIM domain